MSDPLTSPLLPVPHFFGTRASEPPALLRPRQVHGREVARVGAAGLDPEEADAVVSAEPGWVGVVTADCVPILVAREDGRAVAAIHAGWRGLAAGVIGAGVAALRSLAAPGPGGRLLAAVGPRIGACCYEVDTPVRRALAPVFGAGLDDAWAKTRDDRGLLDLGALAATALARAGVEVPADVVDACTRCDAERFHSYRRDGAAAGRLVHGIRCADEA